MDFYQLDYFRILCKYGNFTKASEELMVTQPTVSMAVKKLEEEFQAELLIRDGKVFELTQAGETVLRHAIAIHNEKTQMRQELNVGLLKKREVVRFAVPFTMCPSHISRLLFQYMAQNQSVTLHLFQKGHAAIAKGLSDRSIDLGILAKDMINPLLRQQDLVRVEIYASFSPEHPFQNCTAVTPEMLAQETLLFSKIFRHLPGYVNGYLEQHGIHPKVQIHDGFPDGDAKMAQTGYGVVLVPRHLAGEHSAPLCPPLYCELTIAWNGKIDLMQEQKDLICYLLENADPPQAGPPEQPMSDSREG
ncbi:MAG: LysR family transcriptional regulator [Oscillospiraceae bacterium]|nr:LysR family transcriptional regulator [Oscillospiraceae bacterium]